MREVVDQVGRGALSSDALSDLLYYLPETSGYYEMYQFLAELGLVQF